MQYDICNSITAKKIGQALATFLTNIKNGKAVLSSTTPSSSLSRPTKHPSSLSKMIESKKDKAYKRSSSNGSHISEITSDAISVISKSSRSGRMIYDKDGKLVKQWAGVKDKLGDRYVSYFVFIVHMICTCCRSSLLTPLSPLYPSPLPPIHTVSTVWTMKHTMHVCTRTFKN